ncbi:LysE family translocator [Ignatzschineria sp. LJL83]
MLISMFLFSIAMSITPGPVNTVILSIGINYGLKNSLPYTTGATFGLLVLLLLIGFGLQDIFLLYPFLLQVLAILGSLFICYIAFKIMSSTAQISIKDKESLAVPSFKDGLFMQWLNPKAWLACISGVTMFSSLESHSTLIIFISVYFVMCYLCLFLWGLCGDSFSSILRVGNRMKYFNLLMGSFLIISEISILIDFF